MESVAELRKRIDVCRACSLYQNGRSVESRLGSNARIGNVDLLLVAEAPDKHTIDTGICFDSNDGLGKLLDEWLKVLCPSNNFIITDAVKHYPVKPDGNWRTPTKEEIDSCFPFLDSQIAIYKPKAILGVGDVAYTAITKRSEEEFKTIVEATQNYYYKNTPCFFYYHPGYILHINPKLHTQNKFETLAKRIQSAYDGPTIN